MVYHCCMPGAVVLGYKAAAEQFPPRRLLDFGILAEQAGFDSVWVSDQFHPWRHQQGHAPFSLAWLAALGERTSRVMIGPAVLTPTLRLHPTIVAQAMGTLAVLYPRRMLLGVGTGEAMNEVPPRGRAWPGYPERRERLWEAIMLIRELWSRDEVTFEGRYYRTRHATIYERPPDPIPIYVAGAGPRSARLAGQMGDGFVCTSGVGLAFCRDVLLPAVADGCRDAGRDPACLARVIEMKVSFDSDLARAQADADVWAPVALRAKAAGEEHPQVLEAGAAAMAAAARRRWIISSDPDEHVAAIQAYIDLGFTHLVFHAPTENQPRFIAQYAEQILPRLRPAVVRPAEPGPSSPTLQGTSSVV
jgi:coenzyme F420-dependent glucose-6-phosphate dehydrogenase